jgi:para-aminobenzoate synthetase component I|tara:strand:+ start:729 stop:2087 length:1359 start_codon:yes stop_codon:yes gene_type:complete
MKIEELEYQVDSSLIYEKISHFEWPIFLDSCYQKDKPKSSFARFDIIAANPFIKLSTLKGVTEIIDPNGRRESNEPALDVLRKVMKKFPSISSKIPFVGGAIGYCSYGLNIKESKLGLVNSLMIGIYDWAIVSDHFEEKSYLVSTFNYKGTKEIWSDLLDLLKSKQEKNEKKFIIKSEVRDNLSYSEYKKQFEIVKNYIRSGDCYQINLSKKFEVDSLGDSWALYKKFRSINKSPFMAYLSYPSFQILSGSPERFIKSLDKNVSTRPIKGTRVRGKDKKQDKKNANELLNSPKDRSENLMIVDLLRNDLSINCEPGSIKVDELFAVESYPNVHHLVSTISGKLKKDSNNFKLFKDSFPGGSITGAPKIRAIEIINELEKHPRDFYCGSVCYFSFNESMDSNIAIRSMIHTNNKLHFYSGGGLTFSSNVEDEYQEIEDKSKNIKNAIKFFRSK